MTSVAVVLEMEAFAADPSLKEMTASFGRPWTLAVATAYWLLR
jgi:hypothetical protein